jgi:broad specificity phosphatase PhoE
MGQPLRLLLIRHGEVEANVDFRYLGRRDDPLTARGTAQAAALARMVAESPPSRILSSPLVRATTTAEAIAAHCGVEVEPEERLVEMSFGRWEGMSRAEVLESDPVNLAAWEADPEHVAPPEGESLGDVAARVTGLVDSLRAAPPDGAVALVSHVGPLKVLLCAALGLPMSGMRRLFLDPATVSVVDWGARPVVRLFNSHCHLGWTGARWMRSD